VAVIDLDQMYGFVRQQDGYREVTAWMRAHRGAAALAEAFFATGIAIVIVDGEFFNAEEFRALTAHIPATVARRFFTLQLSYAQALERVQGDPSRSASKEPVFLRQLHAHFTQALPFLEAQSIVIDTDGLCLDAVIARLMMLISEQERLVPG
jgi:hypothetical protein